MHIVNVLSIIVFFSLWHDCSFLIEFCWTLYLLRIKLTCVWRKTRLWVRLHIF